MKIKIIKIKVENENQEFDFSDFFSGSNTIYNTNAQLVKENDNYYWHAFVTYEPKINYTTSIIDDKLLESFKQEVFEYMRNNIPKKNLTSNCVKANIEQIIYFKTISDFKKIYNYGKKSIEDDTPFLTELLNIAAKYQSVNILNYGL